MQNTQPTEKVRERFRQLHREVIATAADLELSRELRIGVTTAERAAYRAQKRYYLARWIVDALP